jgi:hypothetical protein
MKKMIWLLTPMILIGCSKGDDTGAFDASQFEGGTFQFTNNAVSDGCFDGAFDALFLPDGTPNDWSTTTELPSWGDMPSTYTIQLQDPFDQMEITVSASGTTGMTMAGAVQEDVQMDADNYPDCYVDMVIDAELTIVDADNVQGQATLNTSDIDATSCPAFTADPCDILLDLTATRL